MTPLVIPEEGHQGVTRKKHDSHYLCYAFTKYSWHSPIQLDGTFWIGWLIVHYFHILVGVGNVNYISFLSSTYSSKIQLESDAAPSKKIVKGVN